MDPTSTEGQEAVGRWCVRHLGARPVAVLFEQGHLSRVLATRLEDGRTVVLKIRLSSPRIAGCVHIQRHLALAGFPCPMPLTDPAPLGDGVATAETYIAGGDMLQGAQIDAGRFATALARLVALASVVPDVPSLDPPPPWVAWAHREGSLWPRPDDLAVDLNTLVGPEWLDAAARRARARLAWCGDEPIVGHCDWESQNLRWTKRRLHAVHDWDSVASLPEAPMAGAAASVFSATGEPNSASTMEQTEEFLDAYAEARGLQFTTNERELAWAGGLWVSVFNAKKELARGDPYGALPMLAGSVAERLRRANA